MASPVTLQWMSGTWELASSLVYLWFLWLEGHLFTIYQTMGELQFLLFFHISYHLSYSFWDNGFYMFHNIMTTRVRILRRNCFLSVDNKIFVFNVFVFCFRVCNYITYDSVSQWCSSGNTVLHILDVSCSSTFYWNFIKCYRSLVMKHSFDNICLNSKDLKRAGQYRQNIK